ncbi:MAG: hypothetical protein EA379_02145 [Phycisphaerales bacterium]|nr:MAG: hypothetical protein EA379_02145 [Phycisphaerales bacterium]
MLGVVFVSGCSSSVPNRDPSGEPFPSVRGEGLDGVKWTIPDDFAGEHVLLLVGYKQNAQFDIDRWMMGLLQAETPVDFYEIPTIKGLAPRVIGGWIDDGMRKGIPRETWGVVITVYADADRIVDLTGNELGNNARVLLLDPDGTIVWFWDQGYSPSALLDMDRLLRNAIGAPARLTPEQSLEREDGE